MTGRVGRGAAALVSLAWCLTLLLPVLLAESLAAQQAESRGPMLVEIRTVVPPARSIAGGRSYLVHELHLTNFVPNRTMLIQSVEVLGEGDAVLASFQGDALARNFRLVGPRASDSEPTRLAPGQRAMLFLWVPTPDAGPDMVRHRVRLGIQGVARSYVIDDRPVAVSAGRPRILRPPLEGGPWVTANGPNPADVPAHNQLLYPERGVIHVPQRFATDWISLGPDGRAFRGPADRNASFHAYGAPVFAVADGRVVALHDGVPDNRPPDVPQGLAQADRAGNHVILDIGGGAFAFYGHLKPQTILVRNGEHVTAGQKLAAVGNSGNSTGPHLHFHVTSGPGLASEGIPFVFDAHDDRGGLDVSLEDLVEKAAAATVGPPIRRVNDLPLGERIVAFRRAAPPGRR